MANIDAPWLCQNCGKLMDRNTSIGDEKHAPKEGDVSLCIGCGWVYQRTGDRWASITAAALAALPKETRRTLAMASLVVRAVAEPKPKQETGHA